MSKTSLQPTKIAQPLSGKRIQNSKGQNIKSPSICRDGNANPSYHPWEAGTLNNFLTGKKIQCGRKSTYHCNLKTVRWIKGYRNICPIAGCCGTFNRPAPLELSKFNFKQKQITKKIKISNIQVSYQHYATGVDVSVGVGSEKKNWTGYFPHVDIILYRISNNNKTKIQTIRHNKAVPLVTSTTVSASFTKEINNFNPQTEDLMIEINYAGNGDGQYYTKATNPSIIYTTGLKINIDYDYIDQPKIEPVSTISSSDSQKTLITDPRNPKSTDSNNHCRNTITHTIKYTNTNIDDILVSVPQGVTYTKTPQGNNTVIFTYQDASGIAGTKTITYTLKSNKKQKITKKYVAKLYSKPTINITKNYIKNQKHITSNKYIEVTGTCWNNIKIYVDDNKTLLKSFTKPNISQEALLTEINKLSCGKHILKIYIDDIFYKDVEIKINAPQIMFESDLQAEYRQNKTDTQIPITIKRIDSYDLQNKIDVTIIDSATKDAPPITLSLGPYEEQNCNINISQDGTYELKYSYNNGCEDKTGSFGKYIVRPLHVMSYDNLLIRAEDTSIEYDSIVIRKGDKQAQPVTYTDATLVHSMNDVVLFGKDGVCGLGELGYALLTIKNTSQESIKNLCIELNPLIESDNEDEYNPLVMEWQTGMLQNFYDNFNILNPLFKNTIDIINIQNKDFINEGTENVILRISEIKENSWIELKIPFSYAYEKEIYMNFLLLGEPSDFVDLDNIKSQFTTNEDFYNKPSYDKDSENDIAFFASHTSKQEERGCMCISLKTIDLLSADLTISGDDLDRNDMESSDDLDITYSIRLSDADCDENVSENISAQTKILNDCHLIPTAYQIEGQSKENIQYTNPDNISFKKDGLEFFRGIKYNKEPVSNAEVYLCYLDENNNKRYIRTRTDNKGIAYLSYTIPDYYENKRFDINDILDTVDIIYQGDDFYTESSSDVIKYQRITNNIKIWGYVYYKTDDIEKENPIFINANNLQTIYNVADIYVVGQLYDINNQGINDAIIEYNEKYQSSNQDKYLSRKGITCINKTINYGRNNVGKDGFFKIKINKSNVTTYNLNTIKNNSIIFYNGDLTYTQSFIGNKNNQIPKNKFSTELKCLTDYSTYYRGDTIKIGVQLIAENIPSFENYITIDHKFSSCTQNIHIFYQTCTNQKNDKGFKTIFKTNSANLIANQTEAYIYCNVDTDLKILARLQKKIIEKHNVNILTINVINGYKPNKNVLVKAFIGPNVDKKRLGDYLALSAVDIDKEKYSYDQSSDIVYWKVGDMDSYETQICNILLEGEDIGHNTIYVCGFDYLMPDTEQTINTTLTIAELNEKEKYYVDDIVDIKATLQQIGTMHDMYGQIYFKTTHHNNYQEEQKLNDYIFALKCVLNGDEQEFDTQYQESIENLLNKTNLFNIDLTTEDINIINNEINNIQHDIQSTTSTTTSQAQVSTFNNEHYALGHIKLNKATTTSVNATYEGAQMLSIEYTPSTSNQLTFDVHKYDTIVKMETSQDTFTINQNIQIMAHILYNPHIVGSQIEYDTYFDKKLDIKFFAEGQEIKNVLYENNRYVINFMITRPGEYSIKAFIPETYKTEESSDSITITVGENNGG